MDKHAHVITMSSDEVTLKDQLHEYMYCGEEMNDLNLFYFALDTYDTVETQHDISDDTNHIGRPLNRRVPYHQGFTRNGRCRAYRTPGHETLPDALE